MKSYKRQIELRTMIVCNDRECTLGLVILKEHTASLPSIKNRFNLLCLNCKSTNILNGCIILFQAIEELM
jgi:hypothetical protein